MTAFIKSDTHITLVFEDGVSVTLYNTDDNYEVVVEAVKDKDWDLAYYHALPANNIKAQFSGYGNLKIVGGIVSYNDIPMHNTLTIRLLDMLADGFDIKPMAAFLDNLMQNPSYRAVNELYGFLEKSYLPITEDGHFLAYKRIRSDFTDVHSGTYDNSPGSVVKMPRRDVDDNKDMTCSAGLHFCSRSYLSHFGGEVVVMLKINPRDVVSIPSDYDDSKGRCCEYLVVKKLETINDADLVERIEGSLFDGDDLWDDDAEEQYTLDDAEEQYTLDDAEEQYTLDDVEAPYTVNVEAFDLVSGAIVAKFDSPTEAMHGLGIDSSSITKVCDGSRSSAGGYGWRWV